MREENEVYLWYLPEKRKKRRRYDAGISRSLKTANANANSKAGKVQLMGKLPFYIDGRPTVSVPLSKKLQTQGYVSFTQPLALNADLVGFDDVISLNP